MTPLSPPNMTSLCSPAAMSELGTERVRGVWLAPCVRSRFGAGELSRAKMWRGSGGTWKAEGSCCQRRHILFETSGNRSHGQGQRGSGARRHGGGRSRKERKSGRIWERSQDLKDLMRMQLRWRLEEGERGGVTEAKKGNQRESVRGERRGKGDLRTPWRGTLWAHRRWNTRAVGSSLHEICTTTAA